MRIEEWDVRAGAQMYKTLKNIYFIVWDVTFDQVTAVLVLKKITKTKLEEKNQQNKVF